MNKIVPILFAVLLIGCKQQTQVLVDFDVTRRTPLLYEFTNYSHGCDSYKWDFGDGSWAYGTDAYHAYEKPGTYTVTLIGYSDGGSHQRQQTLYVTTPAVYIAGYTLYSIPVENRYYKTVFKDDALLPSSWDFESAYTPLIDEDMLPYSVRFQTPRLMENIDAHDYYTVQLIRTNNAANDDNDVSCTKQKWRVSDIKEYQPEYIFQTESGATAFGVIIEYAY